MSAGTKKHVLAGLPRARPLFAGPSLQALAEEASDLVHLARKCSLHPTTVCSTTQPNRCMLRPDCVFVRMRAASVHRDYQLADLPFVNLPGPELIVPTVKPGKTGFDNTVMWK